MGSTIIIEGAQALRPIGTYTIALGGASTAATTTVGAQIIRLNTNVACMVNLDGFAASTATCFRLSQDQTEYFKVQIQTPAQAITAIGDGTTGVLYITECG